MSKPPIIWTIAGFDPSSGAGITADLKTISSFDCYGVACITALTVQNTLGVRRVEPISPETVRETLQALLDDLPPDAIKIGMLASAAVTGAVADFLEALHQPDSPQSAPSSSIQSCAPPPEPSFSTPPEPACSLRASFRWQPSSPPIATRPHSSPASPTATPSLWRAPSAASVPLPPWLPGETQEAAWEVTWE